VRGETPNAAATSLSRSNPFGCLSLDIASLREWSVIVFTK